MSQRDIGRVHPDSAVLENEHAVPRAEHALLDRFRRLALGNHALDALDIQAASVRQFQGGPQHLGHGHALDGHVPSEYRVRAAAALAGESHRSAHGARPLTQLGSDDTCVGGLADKPLGTAVRSDREQAVRWRFHASLARLLRAGHPSTDPGDRPSADLKAREGRYQFQRAVGLGDCGLRLRDPAVGRFQPQPEEERGSQLIQDDLVGYHRVQRPQQFQGSLVLFVEGDAQPAVRPLRSGNQVSAQIQQALHIHV